MPNAKRGYAFTINNYSHDCAAALVVNAQSLETIARERIPVLYDPSGDFYDIVADLTTLCFQAEVGEAGTPHLQGFVRYSKPKTLNQVKVLLGATAHVEPLRASDEKNHDYCHKGDSNFFICAFKVKHQGKRSDLVSCCDTLKNRGLDAMIEESPTCFVKYSRGLKELNAFYKKSSKPPFRKVDVRVYHGLTGTGKSRKAFEEFPSAYFWTAPINGSAYAYSYVGQEVVVLDDFYSWLPYALLLRILDGYPVYVNTCAGSAEFLATTIIITSNDGPTMWYKNVTNKDALYRRISSVYTFTATGHTVAEGVVRTDDEFVEFVRGTATSVLGSVPTFT